MTQKNEPELVTSGPYGFVRHPIYSGILLGLLGTALATNIYWLIALGIVGVYFVYSATVEERNMTATFPTHLPRLQGPDQDADSVRALRLRLTGSRPTSAVASRRRAASAGVSAPGESRQRQLARRRGLPGSFIRASEPSPRMS